MRLLTVMTGCLATVILAGCGGGSRQESAPPNPTKTPVTLPIIVVTTGRSVSPPPTPVEESKEANAATMAAAGSGCPNSFVNFNVDGKSPMFDATQMTLDSYMCGKMTKFHNAQQSKDLRRVDINPGSNPSLRVSIYLDANNCVHWAIPASSAPQDLTFSNLGHAEKLHPAYCVSTTATVDGTLADNSKISMNSDKIELVIEQNTAECGCTY